MGPAQTFLFGRDVGRRMGHLWMVLFFVRPAVTQREHLILSVMVVDWPKNNINLSILLWRLGYLISHYYVLIMLP